MMKKSKPRQGEGGRQYMIPVVRSTFDVLEEVSRVGRLSLNEAVTLTGVPKSTTFRILSTLCQLGYLVRDDQKRYCPSPKLGHLAREGSLAEGLKQVSLPYMLQLRDMYGETVNLGRLQQGRVRYVEVVPSEYALRLHEAPGSTVDAHSSGLGKAILAFSPPALVENLLRDRILKAYTRKTITDLGELRDALGEVRRLGYAGDRGETSLLATCVAAPILDSDGHALAAMSVSGPTSRFDPRDGDPVIRDLLAAAAAISARLVKPGF